MEPIHILRAVVALSLFSSAVSADDSLRPLDTRTRCIVLFRECLVLIDNKEVNGIFQVIACGGAMDFKLYPDPNSLSADLKRELQDVDRFFERNFRNASSISRAFDMILFSNLVTAAETVSVKNTANDKEEEAKLHSSCVADIRLPSCSLFTNHVLNEDIGWFCFRSVPDDHRPLSCPTQNP